MYCWVILKFYWLLPSLSALNTTSLCLGGTRRPKKPTRCWSGCGFRWSRNRGSWSMDLTINVPWLGIGESHIMPNSNWTTHFFQSFWRLSLWTNGVDPNFFLFQLIIIDKLESTESTHFFGYTMVYLTLDTPARPEKQTKMHQAALRWSLKS